MKIAVTTGGSDGGRSGIGSYTSNLLRQFGGLGTHDVTVFSHAADDAVFGSAQTGLPTQHVADRWRHPVLDVAWHQAALPRALGRERADVLFLPAANRRVPLATPCPMVGTVHDMSSLHMEGKYDPAREFYIRRVLPALYRRLDHVITVSESTRRDLIEHARVDERRISVIPLGVDHDRFMPVDPRLARALAADAYGLHAPYLLYAARIEHPGKNHMRLIEAFDWIKAEWGFPHQLVFVGPDRERAAEVRAAARRARHADDIRFLGFVPEAHLPSLYAGADVSVLPSLFEGFGLPVLEAMACGSPVACSNLSSLPEVAGDAADVFDPYDIRAMGHSLAALLNDPARRAALASRGRARASSFTWRETARRTLEVLEQAACHGRH